MRGISNTAILLDGHINTRGGLFYLVGVKLL